MVAIVAESGLCETLVEAEAVEYQTYNKTQ
jgi:hypothetical protein